MMRVMRTLASSITLLLVAASASSTRADSWLPKTDNRIVSLELRTGRELWSYLPPKLSHAHFELYKKGLVVYPSYSGADRKRKFFLDPNTGSRSPYFERNARSLLSRSRTFWPLPEIKLANGWVLCRFSPGYTKTLKFYDSHGAWFSKWEITAKGWPHNVASWKNLVFYAYSYLSKDAVIYAWEAGQTKPAWTVDLNDIVKGRKRPLRRMFLQVIGNVLQVEANEHIFAIKPSDGGLIWHHDLAIDLGLPFHRRGPTPGSFYGGGLNLAVFAKADGVLIISFEKRVVALDLKSKKYLWHYHPDTFPSTPFPLAYEGKVYLTSGSNSKLFQMNQD